MSFTRLTSSEDRQAWLDARRNGVTATDVSRLAHGGKSVWAAIKAEKAGGTHWAGNEFTRWGQDREPVIARWASGRWPVEHNTFLLRSDEDERWLATPDLVALDDESMLGDIKTAVWRGQPWDEVPANYYDQLTWQMHVTGIPEAVLVVEFHEQFRPVHFEPTVYTVEFDPKRCDELVEIAESFLAMGEPSAMDVYLADWAVAKEAENAAKAQREEVEALIRKEIGDRESFKFVGDGGSISLTTPKPSRRLDAKRVEAAHPDVFDECVVETQGRARLLVKPEEAA